MRVVGWMVVSLVVAVLVQTGAAGAASPSSVPHDAAVDVYVEEFPTAAGAVRVDGGTQAAGATARSGTGRAGLIGLGVVLVGVTAVVVVARKRARARG